MSTRDTKHEQAKELVLPSLLETSLADPYGHCTLSAPESAGLEKLSALWGKVVTQLHPILERNRSSLEHLPLGYIGHIVGQSAPFIAPWLALAQGAKALQEASSEDAPEARALLNGLHEIALAASLLASYGTGPFITRCVQQLMAAHAAESSLPAHLLRLYRHPLTLQAFNGLLSHGGLDPCSEEELRLGLPEARVSRINAFAKRLSPLHSKEQLLVDESLALLNSASQREQLLIATSPGHVSLLKERLSTALRSAPPGFIQEVGRGLADVSLVPSAANGKIRIAPFRALLSLEPHDVARVLLYSPINIEQVKMSHISADNRAQLKAHFSPAPVETLRVDSPLFGVDRILHEQMLADTSPSPTKRAMPSSPQEPLRSGDSAPRPNSRGRGSSISVSIPRGDERMLFDAATLAEAHPPASPLPTPPALPAVDPSTLPKTIDELNERLGITLIKPALVPRPDQLQRLFEMLQEPSFRWLIKASTGFGKTVLASLIMGIRLGNSPLTPAECRRGYRIGYVTPNVDLCTQAKAEFLRFLDLHESEVAVLHGRISRSRRNEVVSDPSNRIIVSTPETLIKSFAGAPTSAGYDSLALLIVDEFQSAEGDHPMARLVREARAAGVPILPQSGTPARDAQDLEEKQSLVSLHGALVPESLQPLKNHDLLNSYLEPGVVRLTEELASFSFIPYVSAREQLLNAHSLLRQLTGAEAPMLFPTRLVLNRKPHIESFGNPSSGTFKKLKAKALSLREQMKSYEASVRSRGESLSDTARQARLDINLASLNIGRMSSLVSRSALLSSAGVYPFLHDFAGTWITRYLESPRRLGSFQAFQDFFTTPEFRGVIRSVAEGTPFIHLLHSPTCAEALEKAFGIDPKNVPDGIPQRRALFLQLALLEMSRRPSIDHPKEAKLFERIEELQRRDQARGILVFAEPRHLTKYLALKLQRRFGPMGLRTAFVTGEGDGFSDRLFAHLESQRNGFHRIKASALGSWNEIREAFQRQPHEPGERVDIIVATSRLSVGHNLSAASEAHIYSMHADAQKLIQQIGRVGRPDGENFFNRVGQCFYHVTRNSPEWYLFLSAIRKYKWIRDTLTRSQTWESPS